MSVGDQLAGLRELVHDICFEVRRVVEKIVKDLRLKDQETAVDPSLTDLRLLLDTLGVKTVVLMGINTNTCVLNTAFTAFNFDYRVVVLSDCVASMYGDDLHVLGLQNVARCLGWVITNEQFFDKISERRQHEVHA